MNCTKVIEKILLKISKEENREIIEYNKIAYVGSKFAYEVRQKSEFLKENYKNKRAKIGLYFPNSIELVIMLMAVFRSGMIAVPIPYGIKEIELEQVLEKCSLDCCVVGKEKRKITKIQYNYDDMYEYGEKEIVLNISMSKTALLIVTSGSTGTPKLVSLSYRNIFFNAISHLKSIQIQKNDRMIIVMPMHTCSAIVTQLLAYILGQAKIYLISLPILPRYLLKQIKEKRISGIMLVPTMLKLILKESETQKYLKNEEWRELRIIITCGAPLPQEDFKKACKKFPYTNILQTYGLSEASPRVTLMKKDDKTLSCGVPVRGTQIKICDELEHKVQCYNIGQIFVKGPNVMQGYYREPELTKKIIRNGWLATGDLGYINENGYLFVVGRIKNLIISGGYNIYPESIEKFLGQFKEFNTIAVLGSSDEVLGESVVACVQLETEENFDIQHIVNACYGSLSSYKVPRKWVEMKEIPFTKTGKIDRRNLKKEYAKGNYRVIYEELNQY